jgi:hypothetical protein
VQPAIPLLPSERMGESNGGTAGHSGWLSGALTPVIARYR